MTSPSPIAPLPYPAQPPRPAPPRPRRRLLVGAVALILVAVCAVAAAWWSKGGESDPLAGRPRVTDTRAGLSYAVPEGWKHDAAKDKDLIDAFSSTMSRASGAASSGGGTVLAGRAGQTVPRADLRRAAETPPAPTPSSSSPTGRPPWRTRTPPRWTAGPPTRPSCGSATATTAPPAWR
ncbi:hypothetical protein O1M54_48040 [Streptomyces diastatochromogenes]|nr:hypothetical protein [Streptomyces diastatochromogenes]